LSSGTGLTTTTATATVASASGTVTDSEVTAVTSVNELQAVAPSLPVTSGLSAYYEAGDFGSTSWSDRSGNGNNLTVSGSPTLITTPTGQAAVRFDGVDDQARLDTLTNFPSGNEARSVFVAVRYNGPGWGGVSWGTASTNNVYGLGVDSDGELVVQAWGSSNDKRTLVHAPDLGWVTHSATHEGAWHHYLNGELLAQGAHTYNTTLDSFIIGAEIDQNPHVEMDVAAVVVYNREVSENERLIIEDYLSQKFIEPREFVVSGSPLSSNTAALAAVEADYAVGESFAEQSVVFAVGLSVVTPTEISGIPVSSVALAVESASALVTETNAAPLAGSVTARTSAFTTPVFARGVPVEGAVAAVESVGTRLTRLYGEALPSAVVGVSGVSGGTPAATASPRSSVVLGSGVVESSPATATVSPEGGSVTGVASVIAPRAVLYVTVLGGDVITRDSVAANLASGQVIPLDSVMRLSFPRKTISGKNSLLIDESNYNQFIPK
jgi:hypothetical protein